MIVSICCLTYNHGSFLREALDSFLSQKTNFEYEIVIGDDASTDSTNELMSQYCSRYSNIRYYRHNKNIGMMPNAAFTLERCTGKFIALCEGDDYWIDPLKLQKQVDFLESNGEYSICVTNAIDREEYNNKEEVHIVGETILIEDLLKQNLFRTATVLFDAKYLRPVPGWFKRLPFGDWATYLIVLHQSKKKAHCLQDITTVRRLHGGGSYTTMYSSNQKVIKTLEWDIEFYEKIQKHLFKDAYNAQIKTFIKEKESIISYLKSTDGDEKALINQIADCVPTHGSFILVDEWCLNVEENIDGKRILRFMERDGVYWGRPADSVEAIAEIRRQRNSGVNMIVFTWQAFWWLEHYGDMLRYLKDTFECSLKNDCLIGFNLQHQISLESEMAENAEMKVYL